MGRDENKFRLEEKKDKKNLERWTVHFSNLKSKNKVLNWEDTAIRRVINRVDSASGKARDYMDIWEIDPAETSYFKGKISLNTSRMDNEKLKQVKLLIAVGLAQVNVLAGTICRVEIAGKGETHEQLIKEAFTEFPDAEKSGIPAANWKKTKRTVLPKKTKGVIKLADRISDIFEDTQKAQRLRLVADVIRELRKKGPEAVDLLPEKKEGKKALLWDQKPKKGEQTLREILQAKAKEISPKNWRRFCEDLGQALYDLSKKSQSGFGPVTLPRLLGETRYYGPPMKNNDDQDEILMKNENVPDAKNAKVRYWSLIGHLRSLTPFFFGTEAKKEQTSALILLNRDGSFRLPRSVIRGSLRRDLRLVFGDGCNMALGGKRCECPICRIMCHLIVEDGISDT